MTEEEFDALKRFGEGLMQDARPEVHAAGKAILLLAAEVEKLQVELWHARLNVAPAPAEEAPAEEAEDASEAPAERTLPEELRSLVSRVARRLQPERFFQRS